MNLSARLWYYLSIAAVCFYAICGYPLVCRSEAPPVLYVSHTGNDTNSGTLQKPFRSIKKGLQAIKPGGTIVVRSGTYKETIDNTIPSGTSSESPTTIKGEAGDGSIIIQPSGTYRVVYISGKSFINIQNLVLDGTYVTHDVVKIDKSSYINIEGCLIQNIKGNGSNYVQGILVNNTSSNVNVLNCTVRNNGRGRLEHGIYINGDNCLVDNSIFYNNSGYGVHVYNGFKDLGSKSNFNTISNCLSYNNGATGFIIGSGTGNSIYNCVSTGNVIGIQVGYNSQNSAALHNTIYKNAELGLLIRADSSGTLVENNISYGNGTDFKNLGAGTISAGNIFGINPQFVDANNKGFRLTQGSPAIGVGVPSKVETDCLGTTRNPTAPDAGAYEFTK